MALVRVDLKGEICVEVCKTLIFNDTTGNKVSTCIATQNNLGYGLTDGIASSSITSSKLNIYYPNLTTPIIFNFTVVNNVITAATLTNLKGVVTNILANLVSTVFPLINFDITLAAYLVTLPEVKDGLYTWDYTINGISGGDAFSYTTSGGFTSDCTVGCCIENKYLELLDCGCPEKKMNHIMKAEMFLWASRFAMNIGSDDKANDFLTKATETCNSECKDC